VKVFSYHAGTRREILAALCAMPPSARAVALRDVTFCGVGVRSNGMTFPPGASVGGWLVCIAERDGARDTVLHEVAHVVHGHRHGGEAEEAEACATAAAWGAVGDSANAEAQVAHAHQFYASAPRMLVGTDRDGTVRITCQKCGARCQVFAPTVPGLSAEVGVSCEVCDWCEVMEVSQLVKCPDCGERATVLWGEDASPECAVARLACACGTSLRLKCEPDAEPEPERPRRAPVPELWPVVQVARRLPAIGASLRRLEAAVQAGDVPDALESGRASLVWLRQLLARAVRSIDAGDSRRASMTDADAKLASAGAELAQRNFTAAADHVARATATLDALLTAAGNGRSDGDGDA
jgi:hypothetical protein